MCANGMQVGFILISWKGFRLQRRAVADIHFIFFGCFSIESFLIF